MAIFTFTEKAREINTRVVVSHPRLFLSNYFGIIEMN